jgi:hypothetical protein
MAIGIIAAGAIRQIFLSIYGTHTSAGRLPVFQLGSEFALGDWWGAFQYALAAVLLALCAMCGRLPVGKLKLHVAALVGAAMCSAC